MKAIMVIIIIVLIAALIPLLIFSCEASDANGPDEPALTEAEEFADEYGKSVEFAESLERKLSGTGYDLSNVDSFKRVEDWASGERYSMWMNSEYVWYAYCTGDVVLNIRDSHGQDK
ncbi:MAG: hypothetical protein ACOX8Q_05180 [Christensenellales bacterium]|jgi:hypothetical protein